ncbi:hypothetical protein C8A01DRAFT_48458 [Parachaetomium inaequale]|uniref:Geranylgeranyl pyrophosphate synthetase n=1 Tax=Parachaetomium inaequale TaxID=2588326 RepID=A0AAN6SPH9_9PEZI|nr:hypothetical protein C8A01DRAFT_48458 [Parachaetomium inaequale]
MAFPWSQKPGIWDAKYERAREDPATISPPAEADLIRKLRVGDLDDKSRKFEGSARIQDVRTVNSYSWVDKLSSGPTILIPGQPPLWTPQHNPDRLKEDSGSYFRDKNAARYPKHPTEPAVVASLAADPTLPSKLDIFACGSTLGNLLRFVRGQDKTFRMLAYKIHNTVFLVRRENSPTELIPGVRGYGHTFPEANTTWEPAVKGSASHQRLIRYTFGGLEVLVRFEADGYIKPKSNPPNSPSPTTTTTSNQTPTLEELTTDLSTTTVTPSPLPTPSTTGTTLTITPAGTPIPHATLFDLKTRSIYTRDKKDHLAEELPRLWVSQIPIFILAYHTQGLFKKGDTEIRDVRGEVRVWEGKHRRDLARLAALLRWVRDVVAEVAEEEVEGGVELCRRAGGGEGVLEVRRVAGDVEGVVSDAVRERWVQAGLGGGGKGDGEKGEEEASGDEEGGDEEGADEEWGDDEWGDEGEALGWDEKEEDDFTACGKDCGYCGRCTY